MIAMTLTMGGPSDRTALRRGRRKDSENRSRSSWWKVGEPDIKLTRLSRMQTSGARVHLKARNRSGERFLRTGMETAGIEPPSAGAGRAAPSTVARGLGLA